MDDSVVVLYNGEPVSVPKEVAEFLDQERKREQAQDKRDDDEIINMFYVIWKNAKFSEQAGREASE